MGNGTAKVRDVFKDIRAKKQLKLPTPIRVEYATAPIKRIREDFESSLKKLDAAMGELGNREAESVKVEDVKALYEHWHFVEILGDIFAERCKQVEDEELESNRLGKTVPLKYTRVISSQEEEIAYLREQLELEMGKVESLKAPDYFKELEKLRREVTEKTITINDLRNELAKPAANSSAPPLEISRFNKSLAELKE